MGYKEQLKTDIHVQKESNRDMKEKCDEEPVIESCHLINCKDYEGQNMYIKEGEKQQMKVIVFFFFIGVKNAEITRNANGNHEN